MSEPKRLITIKERIGYIPRKDRPEDGIPVSEDDVDIWWLIDQIEDAKNG